MKRNIAVMTDKWIKGFCLAIITALSLCSCGSAARDINENAALAKEHVYRFRKITMPNLGGDEVDICASAYREKTVSLLVKVTDWEDYNDNDIRILRFLDEDTQATVSPLETLPQENGYYDDYTFGADGSIYAIRSSPEGASQDPDRGGGEAVRFLCCWAADGRLLWESLLDTLPADEGYLTVNAISVTADGTAHLILTGSHAWQISTDAQGTPSDARQLPDEILQALERSASIIHSGDGSLLLVCYGEEDWAEQYLIPYDPAAYTLGDACRMPSSYGWDGYGAIAADAGSGLLYSSRTGICTYIPGNAEGSEKMNFINSDLNISNFDALIYLDDTSFAGVFYEGNSGEASVGIFAYVEPADIPEKTVLMLAGVSISNDVIQRVVEFNRSSDKYRIVVQNLKEYDSDEELAAGIAEITNSVFSGDMPDILVTEGLPAEIYAAGGFLADIGQLLKKDPDLSRIDFLENVFNAYAIDGKLYYLIPSFKVDTMIGAASVVGDRSSWTFAEAARLLETLPEGTDLIPETDRASFLRTMMTYCGGSFIDIANGKCSFQTSDFPAILKYVKTLPEELDTDAYGEDYWRNYETQYRKGKTVLAGMPISSFDGLQYYVNDIFGEDISYIGFPSAEGAGSYLSAGESYAISSRSEHPEGAWEFLRYYLTDEYQSSLETGLPVQRKYFLESSRTALGTSQADSTPLTEEQLDELISFILSIDHRVYVNEDIINIVNEEAEAFFSGDKTAQETVGLIQNRVQLYLDENLK